MVIPLALMLAAVTTAMRPEIVSSQPTTRNAQLLLALRQAEDDFASVHRDLGLSGSAPLAGIGSEMPVARPSADRSGKMRAGKTSSKAPR
jgi:hypothetical protein